MKKAMVLILSAVYLLAFAFFLTACDDDSDCPYCGGSGYYQKKDCPGCP